MRYVVMAILMTLTCLDLSLAQAATPEERESLRGLPGVEVAIDTIKPDAHADGLSEEAIRTAVELILRSSGIRVLTHSEHMGTPSKPWLYVPVHMRKDSSGLYAFHVEVRLYQRMSLIQQPQHTMSAATWMSPYTVGTVGHNKIREIVGSVENLVKAFANDFLAVNPR